MLKLQKLFVGNCLDQEQLGGHSQKLDIEQSTLQAESADAAMKTFMLSLFPDSHAELSDISGVKNFEHWAVQKRECFVWLYEVDLASTLADAAE